MKLEKQLKIDQTLRNNIEDYEFQCSIGRSQSSDVRGLRKHISNAFRYMGIEENTISWVKFGSKKYARYVNTCEYCQELFIWEDNKNEPLCKKCKG
jgi:hypothetical protein